MHGTQTVIAAVLLAGAGGPLAAQQAATAPPWAAPAALACAPPLSPPGPAAGGLHVAGGQDTIGRSLFSARDLVVVSGGTQAGVELGQRYFARRPVAFSRAAAGRQPAAHTTGWIRIVAVDESTAVAVVDYACDAIGTGDYLEPYVEPAAVSETAPAGPAGELDFSSLGRVVFGKEERRIGGIGDIVQIDRGSLQGVAPGDRFAIYRNLGVRGVPIVSVGEGVVVSTTASAALMRVTTARDAVESGDYVVRPK